ncbi:hypothetical protein Vretifemale_1231 [Volvox reticuliferus]|uniref:Uncharacterized protein n=1 Tax=Volvox reticuliferus TaxID=1737510 RepID=A0A8J4FFY4_9CHLO|nr:hypothetical protein Vretifemale_1231 [Volvox reticuliferus]
MYKRLVAANIRYVNALRPPPSATPAATHGDHFHTMIANTREGDPRVHRRRHADGPTPEGLLQANAHASWCLRIPQVARCRRRRHTRTARIGLRLSSRQTNQTIPQPTTN